MEDLDKLIEEAEAETKRLHAVIEEVTHESDRSTLAQILQDYEVASLHWAALRRQKEQNERAKNV